MSACDTCSRPGACCSDFPLPGLDKSLTTLEAMVFFATFAHPMNPVPGLPFVNPRQVENTPSNNGDGYTGWIASCSLLDKDGRCGDYEHRPYWPCGAYEPGQDMLCAQHVPKIGLCPDLKQPIPEFSSYIGLKR